MEPSRSTKGRAVPNRSGREVIAGGGAMETLRRRPKWVTGLRPKLEEVMAGGRKGILIGRAKILRDMVQVTKVSVVKASVKRPSVDVEGNLVEFAYPLKGTESIDDVYYGLMKVLSNV
ncbi:hypothetical protein [Thermococcus sp.]|uniref:hypothetical protein n=1 Tax=Thermococcus sp. TaxID=35749 RepID=UPI0025E689C3|nr:hypothetical protein [Thermococcus sp.]